MPVTQDPYRRSAHLRGQLFDLLLVKLDKERAIQSSFHCQLKLNRLALLRGEFRVLQDLELPWKSGRLPQHFRERFGKNARKCSRGQVTALIDHDLYPLLQLVA